MTGVGVIGNSAVKNMLDLYTNNIGFGLDFEYLSDSHDDNINLDAERFDILIVNEKTDNIHKYIAKLSKNPIIILNSDYKDIFRAININQGTLITYGFNGKACVTASSVTENDVQICIQRTFKSISGKTIEEQEFSVKQPQSKNIYDLLGAVTAALINDVEVAQIKSKAYEISSKKIFCE